MSGRRKKHGGRLAWADLIVIGLILGAAALVYSQRIWYLRFFTYDQARDALYVKRILDGRLRLIGPQSSIPGLYTAPLYYYLMAPFLFLFGLNPVGIDVAIGLGAVAGVGLLFWLMRRQVSLSVAAGVTLLYAFSPSLVRQAQFGWNPNVLPVTVLVFLLGIHLVFVRKKWSYFWLVGLGAGAAVNFHYSGLGLVAGLGGLVGEYWPEAKKQWRHVLKGGLVFFLLLSPLLIFDLRHGGTNILNIWRYVQEGTGGEIAPPPFLTGLWEKHASLVGLVFSFGKTTFFSLVWLGTVGWLAFRDFRARRRTLLAATFVVYLVGIFFAGLYRGSFFPFYLTFLYPVPFLLTGLALGRLQGIGKWAGLGLIGAGLFLLGTSRQLTLPAEWVEGRYAQLDLAAFTFSTRLKLGERFNLAAVSDQPDRFDHNAVDYRYFIEAIYGIPTSGWDPVDYQTAESLYLISEVGPIDPLAVGSWEVETFGPSRVTGYWPVGESTIIYKLVK